MEDREGEDTAEKAMEDMDERKIQDKEREGK